MDYSKAIDLKKEIASSFVFRKQNVIAARSASFSLGGGTVAAAVKVGRDLHNAVNGVGVGKKSNGEHYLKVFTRHELPVSPRYISQYYGLSEQEVAIQQVGKIEFKGFTRKRRPPFPAVSVGHYKITAGTLGCFVEDANGVRYILSNNHVLANTNDAFFDDPIYQQGPIDGGRKADRIAGLDSFVRLTKTTPNEMDAAIAKMDEGIKIDNRIAGKRKVKSTAEPDVDMKVEKWGRTTGHTQGIVTLTDTDLQVDYDGQVFDFVDQIEINGLIKNGKKTMFCDGGDSGSLILKTVSSTAVALLFAGTDDGTTFATPINSVLTTFSMKIV
jgi:hypothetical protein